MCVYVRVYACKCVSVYMCVCACMCVLVCIYVSVCVYVYVCARACVLGFAYLPAVAASRHDGVQHGKWPAAGS